MPETTLEFERVYTVHHWWDGPRAGVADFGGAPRMYSSTWDDGADDWSAVYALAPIDSATFTLACEDWGIWQRWLAAYHAGRVLADSGPSLVEERPRAEELQALLRPLLKGEFTPAVHARAEFRRRGDWNSAEGRYNLEVRWQPVAGPAAAA